MSIRRNSFIFYLFLICFSIAFGELDSDGENVCSKISITARYERLRENCIENNYRNNDRIKCIEKLDENGENIVYFCCTGYKEIDGECVPKCDDCVHGTCIAPNTCEDCALGFGGLNCGKSCNSTDRFGTNCEHDCKVILNPKLNNNFEFCDSCNSTDSIKCECKDICKCRHVCSPGYYGKDCDFKCPAFKYGNLCSTDCKCIQNNTSSCNRISGECKCKDPYFGELCDQHCNKTTSVLTCTNPHNCTCEFKLEVKLEKLKIEKKNLENDNLNKNNLYIIIFAIVSCIMIILIILSILYKYKLKKTKMRLNAIKFENNNNEDKKKVEFKNVDLGDWR